MIEAKNISYTYNLNSKYEIRAIKNLNLHLDDGEILGIIGKTGSGKSTLVQLLCGLITPTKGTVNLNGKDINKDFKDKREVYFKIGIVFQYPENQLFEKSVFDDIAFGPRNKEISEKDIRNIVMESAQFVNLPKNILGQSIFELSGGEKRKCAIAGVMALNPEILILDEPTSGLDSKSKSQLIKSLKNYHKSKKNIIIFISHNMEEIAQLCTKVLVLDDGKPVLFDNTHDVFKNFQTLKNLGLDITQTQKIVCHINENKKYLNENILLPDEAKKEIMKLLKNRGVIN